MARSSFIPSLLHTRRRLTLLLILLAWFVPSAPVWSQTDYFLRHLGREEGLTQGHVYSIIRDRQGFIWFTTRDGLHRYDGTQTRVFRHDPTNPHSLAGNYVYDLYEDRQGFIWISTRSEGLDRLDPLTGRFSHFRHRPGQPDGPSDDTVRKIAGNDRHLWMIMGKRLSRMDLSNQRFDHFLSDLNLSDVRQEVRDFAIEPTGSVLFLNRIGLYRLEPDQVPARVTLLAAADELMAANCLYRDRRGGIWAGGDLGLYRLEGEHFLKVWPETGLDTVEAIAELDSGELLLAGGLGLYLFEPSSGSLKRSWHHDPESPETLSAPAIKSLLVDQDLIWVGTYGGGLDLLVPTVFGRFPRLGNMAQVSFITPDHKGGFWMSVANLGLLHYRAQDWRQGAAPPAHYPEFANDWMGGLWVDSQGRVWIATGEGLKLLDPASGQVNVYLPQPYRNFGIASKENYCLRADSLGNLWIGHEAASGISVLIDAGNVTGAGRFWKSQHNPKDPKSLALGEVTCMYNRADKPDGFLWLGTDHGAVQRIFIGDSEEFEADGSGVFDTIVGPSEGFRLNLAIFEDSKGLVWLGTGDGLVCVDPVTKAQRVFHVRDGLSSNVVNAIEEGPDGKLWLGTANGLSSFDRAHGRFTNSSRRDSMAVAEECSWHDTDGRLFFGGQGGIIHFDPREIREDRFPPPVAITGMTVDGQARAMVPRPGQTLSFRHDNRVLEFQFAVLDYRAPLENRSAWRVPGFIDDWQALQASRQAVLTRLPPGDYSLEVKGATLNGPWSEPLTFPLHMPQSPWLTWWAKAFYLLALLSALLLWQRAQALKLRREREVVARLRHIDQIKDDILANTSHELRTPLNGIIGLSQAMLDGVAGQLSDKAKASLRMIATSGRRLSALVNDILDYAKIKAGHQGLRLRAVDLGVLAEVCASLIEPSARGKDVALINEVATDLPPVYADEDRLQQILLNLLGNAVKFTEQGQVRLFATQEGEMVRVAVEDSGIGIEPQRLDRIFESFEQGDESISRTYGGTGLGLAITKELIERHGGDIGVRSTLGQGSLFEFTLPLAPAEAIAAESAAVDQALAGQETEAEPWALDLAPRGEGPCILVVEDEPINLQVLHDQLSSEGYRLLSAPDGETALKLIDGSEPVQLVLLDIMMPRMSGYQVCTQIRKRHPVHELPVIFLSAKDQLKDLVEGFDRGGNDYLRKPVEKTELLARVRMHLEIRARHHDLVDAHRRLAREDRMAALGLLSAGLAHEIKNPVSYTRVGAQNLQYSLREFRDFLLELADSEPEVTEVLESRFQDLNAQLDVQLEGCERIREIVANFGSHAREMDREVSRVDVTEGLRSTVDLVRYGFKDSVRFSCEIAEPLEIETRRGEFNQVFLNLAVNACQAIHQKRTEQSIRDLGNLHIKAFRTSDQGVIVFEDDGPGMSAEVKARIFEPFFTTKSAEEGTGLGLALVKDIVHRHQGLLEVQSALGKGTTFRLSFPLAG